MKPKHRKPNKIKQRGRPAGMTFADELAQKRMLREACEKAAHDTTTELRTNIQAQRYTWMVCLALNRAFGFGPTRFSRFLETLQDVSVEVQQMAEETDEEYAWEKIRQRAEAVSGRKITYLYEAEMKAAREKHEKEGWT